MKRLTAHAGEAASGQAAGPASGEIIALQGGRAAAHGSPGAALAAVGRASPHQEAGGPAKTAIWSFGISLN